MKLAINSDQILSLSNYVLGFIAALLMGWGVGVDDTKFAVGLLACVLSFGLAIWMNAASVHDALFSIGRRVVMMIGAFLVAKGWLTDTQAVQAVNLTLTVLPVFLSMWFYSDAPGPNLPGTTIVDPPLKPVTKEEIDGALVLQNEQPRPVLRDGPALP